MNAVLRFAAALSRAWGAAYTLGLPRGVRDERRAELESDLWEHLHLASHEGQSEVRTATEVLLRIARGMPADVLWRAQTGRGRAVELALAHGGSFRVPARRPQDTWFGRNGWVVPVAILLAAAGLMWWMMDSTRLSRIAFNLEAPEHLVVSDPAWELRASCCSRSGFPTWEEQRSVHTLRVTNGADHTALVRIEGLERLPSGFQYSYGLAAEGSAQAHRAFEALQAAYRDRLAGARDFTTARRAFEQNELREFSEAYGSFFGSEPRIVDELWPLVQSWLLELPDTPVCGDPYYAGACSDHIAVPPGSTVDVAVVITVAPGNQEGLVRRIELALVDHAAP